MTSLPTLVNEKPLGIIIRAGKKAVEPVRFWAYMWAADEESETTHWHDLIPVGPIT